MPVTILSVAYPLAPVSPDVAGGAEQILSALDQAIERAGYRSVVVAQAGSKVKGVLIPTPVPAAPITEKVHASVSGDHQRNIDRACSRFAIDLAHFHGLDFHRYTIPAGIVSLATLHLPPAWYPASIWENSRTQLQCVSEAQRRSCPPQHRDLPVIPNGAPLSRLRRRPRQFALALGRVCPEKNFHVALDAGSRAEVPVVLGGELFAYPEHQRYYSTQLVPRLHWPHRFLGPVTFARKQRLLAAARCVLLPSIAPETSSLVAMEALAAGTPAIAFPSGAIPEIIEDGVTGFLVKDETQMAEAILRCGEIDPETCRQRAAQHFSQARMTEAYLALYKQLLKRGRTLWAS
jgi:glycosyltransferase involved in cell wall biosynthesis